MSDSKPSPFGMKVPDGGSNCAKCMYYDPDAATPHGRCGNKTFVKWLGSDEIPERPTEYCCNAFDWEGK